jgi:hypothetical protein
MGKRKRVAADKWVERLFVPVEPAQLSTALRLFEQMNPDDRADLGARALELIKHFHKPGNEPKNLEIGDLVSAIQFRLQAFATLHDRPEMSAWARPSTEEGCDYINGALLEAAATEPIVRLDEYNITFDPNSFFKRVLAVSDLEGEA